MTTSNATAAPVSTSRETTSMDDTSMAQFDLPPGLAPGRYVDHPTREAALAALTAEMPLIVQGLTWCAAQEALIIGLIAAGTYGYLDNIFGASATSSQLALTVAKFAPWQRWVLHGLAFGTAFLATTQVIRLAFYWRLCVLRGQRLERQIATLIEHSYLAFDAQIQQMHGLHVVTGMAHAVQRGPATRQLSKAEARLALAATTGLPRWLQVLACVPSIVFFSSMFLAATAWGVVYFVAYRALGG